jgi:hypothetical protein
MFCCLVQHQLLACQFLHFLESLESQKFEVGGMVRQYFGNQLLGTTNLSPICES